MLCCTLKSSGCACLLCILFIWFHTHCHQNLQKCSIDPVYPHVYYRKTIVRTYINMHFSFDLMLIQNPSIKPGACLAHRRCLSHVSVCLGLKIRAASRFSVMLCFCFYNKRKSCVFWCLQNFAEMLK